MEELGYALGIMAALLHGVAYVWYNIQTKLGQSRPNPASWSIWAFLAILNAWSFLKASNDLAVTLQFIMGSVACFCTFVYVLVIGKFDWPEKGHWVACVIGFVAAVIWWVTDSPTLGNVAIIIAFVISFWPTFSGALRDPHKEGPIPWWIWSIAFAVTLGNTVWRWDGNYWTPIPSAVLLILHFSIVPLSSKRRKQRFSKPLE